ncbi:hypothetical protein ACWDUH_02590 [Micromonospora wenchangensis]
MSAIAVVLYCDSVAFGGAAERRQGVGVRRDQRAGVHAESDPDLVQDLPELARALRHLRGSRSYAQLDRDARPQGLARSTLSNLFNGTTTPTRETLLTFLTACGLDEDARHPWLAAWERVATAGLRRPREARRVRETRPRLLGVKACIQVDPAASEVPAYVPRDLDWGLRTAVTVAAKGGGLVLVIGNSSVGKTRTAFEAIHAILGEWWLIHPDPSNPESLRTFAHDPTPRTVIWLDELQLYLDDPDGLSVAVVRNLVGAGVVLIATMWPDEYLSRIMARVPGQPDPHSNDRELLSLAHVVDVPGTFSLAERRRAEAFASDRRIRIALDALDGGFTQVLAAGPELVRRWENAPADQCYGKALITAALDARRVGATGYLTRSLLEAAAPAYLTPTQQANAPADWSDRALMYATTQLHGAASALSAVPAGMGEVVGYTVSDYLHQHAQRARRTAPLPREAWQALVDHHLDNIHGLARSAERRGQYDAAVALYRRAADEGSNTVAKASLVEMLVRRHSIAELREHAEAGDQHAKTALVKLLAEQGCIDELRQRANSGEESAASSLAELLAERGCINELRQLAKSGNESIANQFAQLLAKQGQVAELYERADRGDDAAAYWLADLLEERGDVDQALCVLRVRAAAVGAPFDYFLSRLLGKHGRVNELRDRMASGDQFAEDELIDILDRERNVDELTEMAESGSEAASGRLSWAFFRDGNINGLRQRADGGDRIAAHFLAKLLADRGSVDELRERASAGDGSAADKLDVLLAIEACDDEAFETLRRNSCVDAVSFLIDLLKKRGHVDELRQRADAGDWQAARGLVDLLAERGRADELQAEVHAGTDGAAQRLSVLASGRSLGGAQGVV